MLPDELARERLRSHLLSTPAQNAADAAAHMCAVQAQDFAASRWALGVRTRGAMTLAGVDAAFDRGEIVRAWTMRGTIHTLAARDLAWILGITGERQDRQAAGARRTRGLDDEQLRRAEVVTRHALAGGGRLTRAEMADVFEAAGLDPSGQRGYHFLVALSMRGVIAQGPIVAREGALTREQYFVLAEEWTSPDATPSDPLGEFFARFVMGHGPAGAADFAWWSGLPITVAREAAARAEAMPDRLVRVSDDPAYLSAKPARADAGAHHGETFALPGFDEYYLPYVDRSALVVGTTASEIGPGKNGMVKGVIVTDGLIRAAWTPTNGIVGPLASDPAALAAVARYSAFAAP